MTAPTVERVRPALKAEIPHIADIVAAAYGEFADVAPAELFQPYLEESCNVAERWEDAEVLVAEADGRIAGTVTFYPDAGAEGLGLPREWAGFRTLAVDPARRGLGIGRALVEACVDLARSEAAPTLGIHTSAFMASACRLYESMGFCRAPEFDLRASAILNVVGAEDDIAVIAYRLELEPAG